MKIIFLISIMFISYSLFSQINNNDKFLQAFGEERVRFLSTYYPDSVAYYLFVLENGYLVTEKKHLSTEQIIKCIPIELSNEYFVNGKINIEQINIFKLPVKFHNSNNTYYSINGTDYIIILRSKEYLNKKFQAKPK